MILRHEHDGGGAALLSLPRDLWVPIAGTARGRINTAYNDGPELLGRDRHAVARHPDPPLRRGRLPGSRSSSTRSAASRSAAARRPRHQHRPAARARVPRTSTASQALAYARSRYYEEFVDGEWTTDRPADIGRIERQQQFIRHARDRVLSEIESRPVLAGRPARRRDGLGDQSTTTLDPAAGCRRAARAAAIGLADVHAARRWATRSATSRCSSSPTGAEPILDYFRAPVRRRRPPRRPPSPTDGARDAAYTARPMKALILAGGAGTRLRPITHTRAKQLVPGGQQADPLLRHRGDGRRRHHRDRRHRRRHPRRGDERRSATAAQFGATITYIPQDAPLGLAHCVLIARDFLGDDDFVMYLGDNLLEQDLGAFVARLRDARPPATPPAAQILLKQVPDPHRFGIASARRGRPRRASWSRSRPTRRATSPSSACTCSTRRSTTPCAAIEPSARGELEITDAIQWLIDQGHRVRSELLTGWWIDTGKLTPLLEANRLLLEKIEPRIDGDGRRAVGDRRAGRRRGRRRDRQLDDLAARSRSAPAPDRRQLHRAVHAPSVPTARSSTARSSTPS